MRPEAGGGLRDLLFLHELLFLLPPSSPPPQTIDFPSISALWSFRQSFCTADGCCVCCWSGLQCWQTINSTAPWSSRSSVAATLPMSCFSLEDSQAAAHWEKTETPSSSRDTWLWAQDFTKLLKLKILAYFSQNNYHPFLHVPHPSPQLC